MQKSKKSKSNAWIVGLIVIIVIVAGIGIFVFDKPNHKQTIEIMVDSGSMTESYLKAVGTQFEKSHPNVNVQVNSVGYSDMTTTALSALQGKTAPPDVFMYYASQSPSLSPYLYNLNSSLGQSYLTESNYISGELASGGIAPSHTGSGYNFVGMPIHTVVGYILVYNKTVFENNTLETGFYNQYHFNITPSKLGNYTALNDVSSYLKAHTKYDNTNNKYALMMPDSSSHSMIDAFYNMFYPYGVGQNKTGILNNSSPNYWTYFGIKNGAVNISYNNQYGVKALEMYKNLTHYEPSINTTPIGYNQQELYYGTGDYAMGIAWSSFIPTYENSSSAVRNNLGISLLPGGFTGYSPTFLGVNPYSKNITLDLQFLKFASSSKEFSMGINNYSYVPSTYAGLSSASNLPNFSWLGSLNNYSKTIVVNNQYAQVFIKASPLFSTLIPDFNSQVLNYFEGKISASAALNTAASEWESTLSTRNITL
jgi:multiple sugar transport system substrate-binding protein